MKRLFHVATQDEIKRGETTDIYFTRTMQVLKAKHLEKTFVIADVTTAKLPQAWPWGILCGVEEVARLFENLPVDVYAMPEGTVFYSDDCMGVSEPVIRIEGAYGDLGVYETPMLGLICQASGIATRAARMRKSAGDKQLIAFGIRRMHPILAPMIDRATFIGGFDGVSSVAGAKLLEATPMGTMPHALIIIFGDQVEAWKAFDKVTPPEVPRIALVDTYYDEKTEAIMAAKALGKRLQGVRLDTPGSRKGDFAEIIREVRWELDLRGYEHVKIYVSGGLSEEAVKTLSEAGADAFGVGTSVSNAPTIDFAMDIVEKDGQHCAKRGKMSGRKEVWRCPACLLDKVQPYGKPPPKCPKCGGKTEPMLKPLVRKGKIVAGLPKPREIRDYVLKQLQKLSI